MSFKVPIGISDFRELREGDYYYVDKTALVRDVLDSSAKVILLPRPRRFGKTLNLSMLRCFFERRDEDLWPLFAGLAIAREEESYRNHFQRYPVIFLNFKDVKALDFSECLEKIKQVVSEAYRTHWPQLSRLSDPPGEHAELVELANRSASKIAYEDALRRLSVDLTRAYQEKVVILIDEYDTPIQAGFTHGYYDEVVSFFRNFLSGGLKDNPHLLKGVLTGVLRVAKESIFSGLNNLAVYSLLRPEFSADFGFTETEVGRLVADLGQPDLLAGIRAWYNGYLFGGHVIYNPWSVLNFVDSADKQFRPYWVSTSSEDLLRELFLLRGAGLEGELEDLLMGRSIEKPIEEDIMLRNLTERPEAAFSLLLMSGYLKAEGPIGEDVEGMPLYRLSIPNREVAGIYRGLFRSWLERGAGSRTRVTELLDALLRGDAETFEPMLEDLLVSVLSYHNTAQTHDLAQNRPERVYQAFILGLLTHLEPRYEVRSNRESGHGRYDVMIVPKAARQPGVVLELKVVNTRRGETPEQALDSALCQIRERDYAHELRARGASPIHEVAAVFDGKRAWVRVAAGG